MHVTTETANLMRALAAGGAELALCASNPLSTQDDTAAALVADYGISAFARNGVDRDDYYAHINAALDTAPPTSSTTAATWSTSLHTARTDVIDEVRAAVRRRRPGSSGCVRWPPPRRAGFPIVAVNDTDTKHMFDNRYGTGQSTLDAIFRATNTLLAGKTVVVAGYGYCGRGVASRAKGLGANVDRHRDRPDQGAGRGDGRVPGDADEPGGPRSATCSSRSPATGTCSAASTSK